MTMTGTEPVSSDNLAAVIQAANLDREVIFAGNAELDGTSMTLYTSVDFADYQRIIIEFSDSSTYYSSDIQCVMNTNIDAGNGLTVRLADNNNRRSIRLERSILNTVVTRIIGIRSGGGQLLADALSRLLREVG